MMKQKEAHDSQIVRVKEMSSLISDPLTIQSMVKDQFLGLYTHGNQFATLPFQVINP